MANVENQMVATEPKTYEPEFCENTNIFYDLLNNEPNAKFIKGKRNQEHQRCPCTQTGIIMKTYTEFSNHCKQKVHQEWLKTQSNGTAGSLRIKDAKIKKLEKENEKLKEENEKLKEDNEDLIEDYQQLEEEKNELEEDKNKLEEKKNDKIDKLEKKINRLNNTNNMLRNKDNNSSEV